MATREPVEASGYTFVYDETPGDGSGEVVENYGRPNEITAGYFFNDHSGATGNPPGTYVRVTEDADWTWAADYDAAASFLTGYFMAKADHG